MRKNYIVLIIISFGIISFSNTDSILEEKYYEPERFILKCFETKDIVLLGEPHHIQQHLVFLNSLIPVLYKHDILNLCYEFLPYDRQKEIDQLITASKFDSKLAADLICSQYFEWTEKEYIDILKTIWQINQSGKKSFRIIGLRNSKIWEKDRFQRWTEADWAAYVRKEIIDKKEKCLIYCGSHHSITKFQQPYYDKEKNAFGLSSKDRLGHFIYKMIGDKSMTIWLHYLWPDKNNQLTIFPCNSRVDSVFNIKTKPFAFFTDQAEIGNFTDTSSIYGKGYTDFKLKFVAEGYIVLNSICDARFTTYQELITKDNIQQALKQSKMYYGWDNLTVKQLNDSVRKSFEIQKSEFENFKKNNCR